MAAEQKLGGVNTCYEGGLRIGKFEKSFLRDILMLLLERIALTSLLEWLVKD